MSEARLENEAQFASRKEGASRSTHEIEHTKKRERKGDFVLIPSNHDEEVERRRKAQSANVISKSPTFRTEAQKE